MPLERPVWPDSARCAVLLTFDNFGEAFDLLRYGHAGGALADGVYATRRGIERVLEVLTARGLPATFFLEGWNARKYAGLARELSRQGHEIAGHGWMHEQWNTLPPDIEQALIARTTDALSEVVGRPPRGWRAPSGLMTADTLQFLHAAGYAYDSSCADDDVPYVLSTTHDRPDTLVELPWQWSLDDAVYFAYPGVIRHPDEVLGIWTREFDAAYAQTGYFTLVCHPRYIGRPARIGVLERLLDHIQSHTGVWFARCEEVAAATRGWPGAPNHAAPARME